MNVTLSVVIATLGRPTLRGALGSIVDQLGDDDELIVVSDTEGDIEYAYTQAVSVDANRTILVHRSNEDGEGNAQREVGMRKARTTHICFLDDDDEYTPDALDAMREGVNHTTPTIFKMLYPSGMSLWIDREIVFGNVGTPMVVVPNRQTKLGEWKNRTPSPDGPTGGDFNFISETAERMGGVEWRDHVTTLIRPIR